MKTMNIRVFDNGGETIDRYTVVYLPPVHNGSYLRYEYLAMNDRPFHPQGFGQHGETSTLSWIEKQTEISFDDLPLECQQAVRNDLGL